MTAVPTPLFVVAGFFIVTNMILPDMLLNSAFEVGAGIKQCGEQFAHFSIIEGIKLPFKVLYAQWKLIHALIPELKNIKEGQFFSSLFRGDPSKAHAVKENGKNLMAALKVSTTAEIIHATIQEHSLSPIYLRSKQYLPDVKQYLPDVLHYLVMSYVISKWDILSQVERSLKEGKRCTEYKKAALLEHLHIGENKRLTEKEQKKELEIRILTELDQLPEYKKSEKSIDAGALPHSPSRTG